MVRIHTMILKQYCINDMLVFMMNKFNGKWSSTTELVANINNSCTHFTGIDLLLLPGNTHNCQHLRSRNIFEYVLRRASTDILWVNEIRH